MHLANFFAQKNTPKILYFNYLNRFRIKSASPNVVVESATKWIGGHGTSMGGIIVDGGNYDWGNGKFPKFTEPSESFHGLIFSDTFGVNSEHGNIQFIMKARLEGLKSLGASMSPL